MKVFETPAALDENNHKSQKMVKNITKEICNNISLTTHFAVRLSIENAV